MTEMWMGGLETCHAAETSARAAERKPVHFALIGLGRRGIRTHGLWRDPGRLNRASPATLLGELGDASVIPALVALVALVPAAGAGREALPREDLC